MVQAQVGPGLADSGLLRLVSLFDPLDTPFGVVDARGSFLYLNPALEQFFEDYGIAAPGGYGVPRLGVFAEPENAVVFRPDGTLDFDMLPLLDKALIHGTDSGAESDAEPVRVLLRLEPYTGHRGELAAVLCTIQPYPDNPAPRARGTLDAAQPSLLKRWKDRIEEIGDSPDIARISAKACKLMEEMTGARAVAFWWLDTDKRAASAGHLLLGESVGDSRLIEKLPSQLSARAEWLRRTARQLIVDMPRLARDCPDGLPEWISASPSGFLVACRTRGDLLGLLAVWGDVSRLPLPGMNDLMDLISFQTAQAVDHARWFQFARHFSSRGDQMVENANALFLGLDVQGRVTLWNRKCAEVFGYEPKEALGQSLPALLADRGPDSATHAAACGAHAFVDALKTGQPVSDCETTLFDKSGRQHVVIWNTTVLTAPGGAPLGASAVGQDITRRKELERNLATSERRYRTLIETTHDLYWVMRTEEGGVEDAELTFLNRGLAGRSREELLSAGTRGFAGTFRPADWARFAKSCREVLLTGRPRHRVLTEHAAPDENHPPVWLMHDIYPCFDGLALIGVQGLSIDVTETKDAEARMLQAQKLESLGTLARGIAHDFNNLLNGIQGLAYMIQRAEGKSPEDVRSSCQSIQELVKRAGGLTRQLQTYARQGRAEKRPLDLNEMTRQSIDILSASAGQGVEIRADLDEALEWIEADRSQIDQVIMNLCINAVEAMSGKGVLTLCSRPLALSGAEPGLPPGLPGGEYSVLQVSDTGCGMPPHIKARIFDPFYTTKKTGNGLGLSAVYGILKAHQAAVKVDSEPGVGTCFTLYFPAAPEARAKLLGGTEAKAPLRGGNETILVVDDEEPVRNVAADILATLGYRVITAADGEAALRVFQERPQSIDLVLTDIAMPNLHGRAAAKAMRMIKPSQRFLFTSGFTDDMQAETLRQDGFNHFIGKPYAMVHLQAAIRKVLDE